MCLIMTLRFKKIFKWNLEKLTELGDLIDIETSMSIFFLGVAILGKTEDISDFPTLIPRIHSRCFDGKFHLRYHHLPRLVYSVSF